MSTRLIVTRDVTTDECAWLEHTVEAGTVVVEFEGCTYGCISPGGTAVSEDGGAPFFELPNDAIAREVPWTSSRCS